MPFRMLVDAGTVAVADCVLVGARNLDPPEEAFIAEAGLLLGEEGIERALAGADAAYVALDCDVLDPAAGAAVFMPEPDGPTIAEVEALLARVAAQAPIAGLGLTGLVDDEVNVSVATRFCTAAGF